MLYNQSSALTVCAISILSCDCYLGLLSWYHFGLTFDLRKVRAILLDAQVDYSSDTVVVSFCNW